MTYDLWFCRYEDSLWVVTARRGDHRPAEPRRVSSVKDATRFLRKDGNKVAQVGILPPYMMGLEDIEV